MHLAILDHVVVVENKHHFAWVRLELVEYCAEHDLDRRLTGLHEW